MAGSYWFDGSRVLDAVRAGLRDGLNEVGDNIAANARQRAPIRKVFAERRGYRRKFRALSGAERSQAVIRAVAYKGYSDAQRMESVAYLRGKEKGKHGRYVGVEIRRRSSANTPANSRTLRHIGTETNGRFTSASGSKPNRAGGYEPGEQLGKALTSHGKYEVRSGRAIHREVQGEGHTTSIQIGGALKASIGNEGVTETPNGSKVTVSAAIRYAKYVEFPTIHNAAQPFLLPALHDERGKLVGTIASAIRKNLGG